MHSMSKQVDVIIVYIGHVSASSQINESGGRVGLELGGNRRVVYIPYGKISWQKIINFGFFLRGLAKNTMVAVLTTGYHPNEMMALLMARSCKVGVFSIVFDTHAQGNSRMNPIKRWAANIYFSLGYKLLSHVSGVIVLNDLFIKNQNKKFRYLKSKIGGICRLSQITTKNKNEPVRFFYAGTLNEENGVLLILEFLNINTDHNVEIVLAGYGELTENVRAFARRDSRLKFFGSLAEADLINEIAKSNFLFCLRDPYSPVCQYAFPSKLIKFMSSGVPVIANKFPGLGEEYYPYLLLIENFTAAALSVLIGKLNIGDYGGIGDSAKSYISATHRWSEIAQEMLDFMFPLSANGSHRRSR